MTTSGLPEDRDGGLVPAGSVVLAGRRVPAPTVHRWCTRGVRGTKLESLFIGGQRFVTADALAAFVAKLNRASAGLAAH